MTSKDKASPFVPTEIQVGTVENDEGALGILSMLTTQGLLEIALDQQAADAILKAVGTIKAKLDGL
ncbi:hypothetical protein [Mesorhizobium argentiipisi]|uniref:Uncharacterized protein n=1 Tax=Mesorhizobium argentiipisi TaxID=3015175 RepID=A0ABU8KML1_9HYPH